METNVMTAAWTTYSTEISKEEMIVFQKAMASFLGVHYTPLVSSIQSVSGTNYRFSAMQRVFTLMHRMKELLSRFTRHQMAFHISLPLSDVIE